MANAAPIQFSAFCDKQIATCDLLLCNGNLASAVILHAKEKVQQELGHLPFNFQFGDKPIENWNEFGFATDRILIGLFVVVTAIRSVQESNESTAEIDFNFFEDQPVGRSQRE
jgi:hypothetical protein